MPLAERNLIRPSRTASTDDWARIRDVRLPLMMLARTP